MTNIDIVQMLADGYKPNEIAEKYGTTKFYVDKKIKEIRERLNCTGYGHVIAEYFRKKLIE